MSCYKNSMLKLSLTMRGLLAFKALFLSLLLVTLPVQANIAPHMPNHGSVWQSIIETAPEDKGVFNRTLRESVRAHLNLIKVSEINAVDMETVKPLLYERLKTLDKGLSKFVRVSQNTNQFVQLKQFMPALKIIEEYKLITRLLKSKDILVPTLRNSRLLVLLDRRITQVANRLIFNMKALVRERRPYEPNLMKAMASYGVVFSARPPDFILEYSLFSEGVNDQGEWVFQGRIALLNDVHIPIVKVDELIIVSGNELFAAQSAALEVMAKLVTMQLRIYLISNA